MINRNYRQAKRSREESRKKRQQEKLLRKASRVAVPAPVADSGPPAGDPGDKAAP